MTTNFAFAAEPATYDFGYNQSGGYPEPGAAFSDAFAAIGQPNNNLVTVYLGDLSASLKTLQAPVAEIPYGSSARFGQTCAWHGDTLWVGAPGLLSGGVAVGRVYRFERSTGNDWVLSGTLENPEPARPGFGHQLLVHGNTLWVASEGIGGRLHEFQHSAGTWVLASSMNFPANPNAASTTQDPATISCLNFDGTNLLLGIGRGENDRGLLAVYRKVGEIWQEQQRLTGPTGSTGRLGSAACFADGELLVGAPKASGVGRVARYRLPLTGPLEFLGDLTIPAWVKGAGASIAHHDGRIMVGAPSSSFNPNRATQGALLIADRDAAGTGWEWTGCIADPAWENNSFGSRLFATADRFFVESQGFGKIYIALEPGPRVSYAYLPALNRTDEEAAIVHLGIATSRPVNTVQIFERGPLSGTATAGADYVPPFEIDFLYPDKDWHELPVIITKDLAAEPTETLRMDEARIWGADRFGDNPVISIDDRAPRNGELPPQVIGHVIPPVTEMRDAGFWVAPENMSMSDNELLLGYYRSWGDNQPRILRFVRNANGQWISASALDTPPPSLAGDRKIQPGALVHDESLILLGEDGDLYTQGHIRSFVKSGSGEWISGPAFWPTAHPVGTFGSEIILTHDWVFANQGVALSGHSGFIHIFRRQGGTLTLHSVLNPSHAGLTGDDWGTSRAVLGNQLAWSPPYLAASFTSPGSNALQNRGVVIFRWNEAANKFDYLQKFNFQEVASKVQVLEFSQGMLIAGHDNKNLRCYVPRPSGLFEEVAPQLPPANLGIFQDWSVPSPTGFLVGLQESQGYYTFAAVPQAIGFERSGDALRPTLSYLPIHPWHTRGELYSNVSPAGRFAVLHSDPDHWNRREVMIVEMGRDLPALTITPEVNQVGSTREAINFSARLNTPATMPFPLVMSIEGVNGGKGNRDYAPVAKTRFIEAGETAADFSFRLLDNPSPVPGAAVRARPTVGYGLANPNDPSPSVAYVKEHTTLPTATQRIVPTPGSSFFEMAFDGSDLLFRRIGGSFDGHATRTRNGRVFTEADGPTFSQPNAFPRTDRDSDAIALYGDLVVLGRPGEPHRSREDSIQFGRKTGPGQWQLGTPIPGPQPFFASSLGSQTASNGRFIAIAQRRDTQIEPQNQRMLFHIFDTSLPTPVMICSVGSAAPMLGSPLMTIDQKNRLIYRDFREAGACLAVAQISSSGITPAGTINPRRDPRITWENGFGQSVQCAGNFVIASDPGGVVDGVSVGAVYVFEETSAGWETRQILFPQEPVFLGSFGHQIAVDRDWLVIGEPFSAYGGSIHFYRTSPDGYQFVKSIHAFTPPINLERNSAMGGALLMRNGCLLAPAIEQQPSESNQAIYAFDLTRDESFAAWCSRMGFGEAVATQDTDGDGLDLWMEWATGNNPGTHEKWWGNNGKTLWFESGSGFNGSVRLIIEHSDNLSSASWRTIATRDGLAEWKGNSLPQVSYVASGKQQILLPLTETKGFYRMRAEARN